MRARYRTLAHVAVTVVAGACTSFTPDDPAHPPPIAGPFPDPIGGGNGSADAGDASPGSVADAAACTPFALRESFDAPATPSSWQPILLGGGDVGFVTAAASPPFALHASGKLSSTASSRALLRTKRMAAVQGSVDLTYQMSFDTLPNDAQLDAGCILELARADNASVRAWIAAGFGIADGPAGLEAHVEVAQNGSTAALQPGSAVWALTDQIGASAWYGVHVHAVVSADEVRVDFDVASPGAPLTATGMTVPFKGVEAIVLSCGVDGAFSNPSGTGTSYGLGVDDVVLRACP